MQEARNMDDAPENAADFLSGGGEMGARIRAVDWSKTPLGPVEHWPQSLKTAVRIMLTSRQPMWLGWGEKLIKLYNDAYKPIVAGKHPEALGQPASAVWREIWNEIEPMLQTAMSGIEGTYVESQLLIMERSGYPEETYYTFSFSPIPNDQGGTGGIICANTDDTQRVLGERRLNTLRELAAETAEAKTVEEACELSARAMSRNLYDLSFTLLYLLNAEAKSAHLAGATGLEPGTAVSPRQIEVTKSADAPGSWPLRSVLDASESVLLTDLPTRFGNLPGGPWPESSHSAMVLPIAQSGQVTPTGFLVAGISPRRAFDDNYKGFLELVAGQVATAIGDARAYEAERKRADALAELDRAKTEFFSNVSHEFRTPLTLMLGPLEEALSGVLDPKQREELEVVHRNGLRLQKLVNTLLDFSRIEAGRIQAVYEPTDLARHTAELASVFRSAIERAGMRLVIDCPPLPEPVYVDRDMWEKIVLNLLSNAFKFTFAGAITVSLRPADGHVELRVRDTGAGIAEAELPHLFERFHRIRGAQARTHEGTGIGLALVQELAKLHGGSVSVESAVGEGTAFTVSLPTGSAHLPADRIGGERTLSSTAPSARAYVEEALRWLPEEPEGVKGWKGERVKEGPAAVTPSPPHPFTSSPAHILLADDNADMREYVKRILSSHWTVEAVSDGKAALDAARQRLPDLVLADVMMPGLDGFELLRELRSDPLTREAPIILLSARAGEESRIEGMEAGADDYLTKPFSARELLARVGAHLQMARVRSEANRTLRESEEKYRLVVEGATGFALFMLDVEGRVASWNAGAEWLLGYEEQEILGQHFSRLFRPADQAKGMPQRELERAARNEQAPDDNWLMRKDGSLFWASGATSGLRDESGELRGFTKVVRDITERKLAEEEREQLLAAERGAREAASAPSRAKDEFLATVSHELRNPLNAMLGWARLLSGGALNPETAARGLKAIEQNAKAQAQLIEDLLDVSRIISGKFRLNVEQVQAVRVIEAAIDSVRPAADAKGVRLEVTLDPDAGPVSGDAGRLQQVVWNLLSNAVKFTPTGGRVEARLTRVNSDIEIEVSDTGQGIEPEFLPYVFDRFRQADGSSTRAHGGLGLGLAIVRHIAELHGGSVAADSAGKGRGATFTVRLPLMVIHTKKSAEERIHPRVSGEVMLNFEHSSSLDGVKVLVVDDELDTLLLLSEVLTHSGAYVRTAASASEGFTAVKEWRPDVIVSDIGMPNEDGYAFIRRVRGWARQEGARIPAVALTAYARAEDRVKALVSGYQIHVPKPVEPMELITVIASLADRR